MVLMTALSGLIVLVLVACLHVNPAVGHGRMVEPAARNAMWRYKYKNPRNYNDMGLNCGGFTNQFERHRGKCGACGDPWEGPREHEAGGKYARGVVARQYQMGAFINVTVQLTSNHMGYFEFRLCPVNDPLKRATHACLDRHLLNIVDHGTRYFITRRGASLFIEMAVILPRNLQCSQCVLQWKWVAGQSMGPDGQGGECLGCGNQENFINCADIAIGNAVVSPLPALPGETPSVISPPPAAAGPSYDTYNAMGGGKFKPTMALVKQLVDKIAQRMKSEQYAAVAQARNSNNRQVQQSRPRPRPRPRTRPPVRRAPKPVRQTPEQVYRIPKPVRRAPTQVYRTPEPARRSPAPRPVYNTPQPVRRVPKPVRRAPEPVYQEQEQGTRVPTPSSQWNRKPQSPPQQQQWQEPPHQNMWQPQQEQPIYGENEWNPPGTTELPLPQHPGYEPGEYPEPGEGPPSGETSSHSGHSSSNGENSYAQGYNDALQQLKHSFGQQNKANTALHEVSLHMQESHKRPGHSNYGGPMPTACPDGSELECVATNAAPGSDFDSFCSNACNSGQCPTSMCACTCPGSSSPSGSSAAGSCRAVDRSKGSSMDQWCSSNCKRNNCPQDMCTCH